MKDKDKIIQISATVDDGFIEIYGLSESGNLYKYSFGKLNVEEGWHLVSFSPILPF